MNQNPQGQAASELWERAKIMEKKWIQNHCQQALDGLPSFTIFVQEQQVVPAHHQTASQQHSLEKPTGADQKKLTMQVTVQ